MKDLGDTDFIKESIESVEEYTSEFITVFTVSGSTGTPSSLDPKTITWGCSEMKATVKRISAREINESGGIYKSDDLACYSSGSYSQDAKIVYRTGTYDVVEKPAPTTIDEIDVRWRSVLRRA